MKLKGQDTRYKTSINLFTISFEKQKFYLNSINEINQNNRSRFRITALFCVKYLDNKMLFPYGLGRHNTGLLRHRIKQHKKKNKKKNTGCESWAHLLYWLMKYLAQSMLPLFRHTKIWCRCCELSQQHRHRWYKRSPHLRYQADCYSITSSV